MHLCLSFSFLGLTGTHRPPRTPATPPYTARFSLGFKYPDPRSYDERDALLSTLGTFSEAFLAESRRRLTDAARLVCPPADETLTLDKYRRVTLRCSLLARSAHPSRVAPCCAIAYATQPSHETVSRNRLTKPSHTTRTRGCRPLHPRASRPPPQAIVHSAFRGRRPLHAERAQRSGQRAGRRRARRRPRARRRARRRCARYKHLRVVRRVVDSAAGEFYFTVTLYANLAHNLTRSP